MANQTERKNNTQEAIRAPCSKKDQNISWCTRTNREVRRNKQHTYRKY